MLVFGAHDERDGRAALVTNAIDVGGVGKRWKGVLQIGGNKPMERDTSMVR